MRLFEPVVPEERLHPNFRFVLAPYRQPERDLLSAWAEGFVDRDGKLIHEFQTTFNSSFWEIYLHAVFRTYAFETDWSHAAPDFRLRGHGIEFNVEAVTANAAAGKPNEWDKLLSAEELAALKLKSLNTEAMIRLSGALISKSRKFEQSYSKLDHLKGRPFVVAIAPFEQPHFQLQYDRPIRALLYDYYVDEDAYLADPSAYPHGAPGISLGHVTKENGADLPLGVFNDASMAEISAVIFSCTATWGKLSSMCSPVEGKHTVIRTMWASPPNGAPIVRQNTAGEQVETIVDGLQVYHNPYARNPLLPSVLRAERVVQHYRDMNGDWVYESRTDALLQRSVFGFTPKPTVANADVVQTQPI